MKSKLIPSMVCCLLYAICLGQWSSPVPLLGGSPYADGQSIAAGAGDTMWATVVSTAPCRVYACWTTGDTWSRPVELGPPDSNPVFHDPGMGRDASGRMWAAWYKDLDSSGVWAAFRDSAGWHASRVYGSYAAGPMSFAADAAGNWYVGFATLMPYSSAVHSRWTGDSWESPRYIAQGMGDPIETNFPAPVLVRRPDSGLWVVYEIDIPTDSFAMLSILQNDTLRWCWYGDGIWPTATADSSGRLWIVQSLLGGYLTQAVVIDDSVEVGNDLVSEYSIGRAHTTTDFEGIVWAAWQARASAWVAVNYSRGGPWSAPEQTSVMTGVPKGIAADANGRVYVLFRTAAGQLYSVYRTSRPGVAELGSDQPAASRVATIVHGVLPLPTTGERRLACSDLLDAMGRRVMSLQAGANDVSGIAPGVYFVREAQAQAVRKVVITK